MMAPLTDEQILARCRSAYAQCLRCGAQRVASARYCNYCGETETQPHYDPNKLRFEVLRLARRVEALETAGSGVAHA